MLNEITLKEFENIADYLLENNKTLVDNGLTPIAIGIEGEAGVGKTTTIIDLAKKKGMTICKLNLTELEEIGDLTGIPFKEYLCQATNSKGETVEKWVSEKALVKLPSTVKITDRVRTAYAPPAWLPSKENPNGTVLILDDYSRAQPMFMQAVMELINTGKYVSWSLPKYTSVITTSNPDNGSYSVSSLDQAQKTRLANFNIKFSLDDWGGWAENNNVDSRAINFALMYGNQLFLNNGAQIANPRSYVTFCKAISGLKDWADINSLGMIMTISKGCFLNDEENLVGDLFTAFIQNKLDKLPTPEDMIKLSTPVILKKLEDCIYDNGQYRADIASVLAIRLLNYSIKYLGEAGSVESMVNNRLIDIVKHQDEGNKRFFSEDLVLHIVKNLNAKFPGRTGKLIANPLVRNKLIR